MAGDYEPDRPSPLMFGCLVALFSLLVISAALAALWGRA